MGTLVAANHVSMVDFLLVPASFGVKGFIFGPTFYFMTANRYLNIPFVGSFLRVIGGFPAKDEGRGNHGIVKSVNELSRGNVVVIFPEGGLPINGESRPPKSGVVVISKKANPDLILCKIVRPSNRHTFFMKTTLTHTDPGKKWQNSEEIMSAIQSL